VISIGILLADRVSPDVEHAGDDTGLVEIAGARLRDALRSMDGVRVCIGDGNILALVLVRFMACSFMLSISYTESLTREK